MNEPVVVFTLYFRIILAVIVYFIHCIVVHTIQFSN